MTIDAFRLLVVALVVLGRLGDILSTRFVTPNLVLEANPIARRMGWPGIWITSLLLPVIALVSVEAGIVIATGSLLVTFSNLSRSWVVRALGEHEYQRVIQSAALRSPQWVAQATQLIAASVLGIAGVFLLVTSGGPDRVPYWFAVGILAFAAAIALHSTLATRRLYRGLREVGASGSGVQG